MKRWPNLIAGPATEPFCASRQPAALIQRQLADSSTSSISTVTTYWQLFRMKRITIQWSLLFLILITASVACVFSAIRFFQPETPKRIISGSVVSNNDTSAIKAFDWLLMQSAVRLEI